MMAKIVEMTMDGRLSIVWAAVVCFALALVLDAVISRPVRNRRVSVGQRQRKY